MALSGSQRTRLGQHGGARAPFGSFVGKTLAVVTIAASASNRTFIVPERGRSSGVAGRKVFIVPPRIIGDS